MAEPPSLPALTVRYDGLDADHHEIEVTALAESLRGVSRIVTVCSNFAATERLVLHKDALAIRVVVRPPETHCFSLTFIPQWLETPLISTVVGGLIVASISYVFKRAANQRAEMKELRGALDLAIRELGTKDQKVVDRMLSTIDKMADALRPAAKQAVAPIGRTASTLSFSSPESTPHEVVVDEADRDAILADNDLDVGEETTFKILITELDMETGGCRVTFPDATDERILGRITDPAFAMPNNPYAVAMAAKSWFSVKAKPTLRDGVIERLFISNTA